VTGKRRSIPAAVVAGLAAAALVVLPALPAAAEKWSWGASYNCGSNMVQTSMLQKGDGYHYHGQVGGGGQGHSVPYSAAYTWSYWTSGYTTVSSATYINSTIDISSGGRGCDW
jgi:hypothetical protein